MAKRGPKDFFLHMIDYIREPKNTDINKKKKNPRLFKDLPSLKEEFYNSLLFDSSSFVDNLIEYIYEENQEKIDEYLDNSQLLTFDPSKFGDWTSYKEKNNISNIIEFLRANGCYPKSYVKGSAKIGFASTVLCKKFLTDKFPNKAAEIENVLNENLYPTAILMPLRIHKYSNGSLTFSPDPESGEIVAFSELFSKDLRNKKCRPIIGYCIVDTPNGFNIYNKKGTKLYKALAEYVDILIIDDLKIYFNLLNSYGISNYIPKSIIETKPLGLTEEMAVVSTYLNQSTINSDWKLCFIHTHHSSWQQLVIYDEGKEIKDKIDRVSTKVDLIMQKGNLFMIAEGKNDFNDIIADGKLKKAMEFSSQKINNLYLHDNMQFDAFIYNLHTTSTDKPSNIVQKESERISAAMKSGQLDVKAYHDSYVVIIVYLDEHSKTCFKLVYSPNLDSSIKEQLDKEFNQ